ncbi:MAG: hypothetical protein Tsb0034_27760 [Ekhidna sp.]
MKTSGSLVLTMLLIPYLYAQEYLETRPTIESSNANIVIDGILDEGIWRNLTPFEYVQFRPDWGKADSLTQLFVTFDDQYLYVAAKCLYPEPEKIVARNLVRDGWKGDDWFTFHIDSYGDKQNAFVFSIYPLGSRYDMAISNDGIELGKSTFNKTYDMIWEGKSTTNEQGWFIEMKIPLSNLRFQPTGDGKIISAISSARTINSENELYVFPAIPQDIQNDIMRPSMKQPVEMKGLKPKKQLLITPYLLAGRNKTAVEGEGAKVYNHEVDVTKEIGLDVRYGISPKLTLDLTYNTDFSQVEADDQVVNLGRFSIFFPEKRRFFQEQAGLYEVDLGGSAQLFYSRNIGIYQGQLIPVLGGGRLNGKIGEWDVGTLFLRTQEIDLADGGTLFPENFGVTRLRKKLFNNRSFVGLMGTVRSRPGYENYATGVDALVNLKNDIYLLTSFSYAYDEGAPNTRLMDNSRFFLRLQNQVNAGWIYTATYNYSAPNFNPGIGFIDRANFHNPYFALSHGKFNERDKGKFQYVKWTLLASDQYWTASSHTFETWYTYSGVEFANFKGDNFDVSHVRELQNLQDTLYFTNELFAPADQYFFHYAYLGYYPARQRKFNHYSQLVAGSFYGGRRVSLTYAPSFNINKHFNLSGRWRMNYLDLSDNGSKADWIHVAKLTVEMAANLHLSGSVTMQYNTATNSIFNNARLRYNFRDGHDLYLVYNETFNTDRTRVEPVLPMSAQQTLALKYLYTFSK